jgi:hypothetical protein
MKSTGAGIGPILDSNIYEPCARSIFTTMWKSLLTRLSGLGVAAKDDTIRVILISN